EAKAEEKPRTAVTLDPDKPIKTARAFVGTCYFNAGAGLGTMQFWQGEFWVWGGEHWKPLDAATLRAKMYEFLEGSHKSYKGLQIPFDPTKKIVTDAVDALAAVVNLEPDRGMPGWLGSRSPVENLRELVGVRNGLLYLPERRLLGHTPRFWSPNVLEF